jgi:hypothetical protein
MTTQIVTTEVFDLTRTKAPNLPIAPVDYNRQYADQLNNVLRLYFSQIDNFIGQLSSNNSVTTANLRVPYGAFSSNLTQTTTANTATQMTMNTTDFTSNVTLNSSNITVEYAGIYNLQFSAQVENADNDAQDVYIWLRQNGSNIIGSTGKVGMPARKNVDTPSHDIKGWNYFLSMNAGDNVSIFWSTTQNTVTIPFYAASGSPTKPSTQSVVTTLTFVSALPT